jgi:hypothetical protein
MNRALAALLLLASAAQADTLVMVHQGAQQTMDGTFSELVIGDTFGALAMSVDYVSDPAPWDVLIASGFDDSLVPWSVDLTFTAGDPVRETIECRSLLRYFDGYVTLTLTCP